MIRHATASLMSAIALLAPLSAAARGEPDPPQFETYIGAGLSTPIGLTHAGDGSGRLFVNQQGGAVRVIRNDALLATPFLTIPAGSTNFECTFPGDAEPSAVGFTSGGERGLLGLAFHPLYATNGRLFLSITDGNGDTLVLRMTAADPSVDVLPSTDLETCTVLLRADQDFTNHNGGHIAFGPDGYLYLGLGDGGDGGDPCNRGQTLAPADLSNLPSACAVDGTFTANGGNPDSRALLGKMLRIDVDVDTAAGSGQLCGRPRVGQPAAYGIPAGNPGAGGVLAAACDEVWAYGLRNPWRYSFDRETGDLWIGDVGQGTREEVNFEPSGAGGRNYGWKCREGTVSHASCSAPVVAFTEPALDYARSSPHCSITGGYRYRGPVIAAQGQYYYGDYCSAFVWIANETMGGFAHPGASLQDLGSNLTSFGEGEDGELYAMVGNTIRRLNGARVPPEQVFEDGFESD